MVNSRKRPSEGKARKGKRLVPKRKPGAAKGRPARKRNPGEEGPAGSSSRLVRGVRVYGSLDEALRDAPIGEAVAVNLLSGPSPFSVLVRYGDAPSAYRLIEAGLSEPKAVAVAHSSNDLLEAMARPNPSGRRKAGRSKAPRRMQQQRLPNPLERLTGEVTTDGVSVAGTDDRARNEQMSSILHTIETRELVHAPGSPLAFVPWVARYLGLEGDPVRVVWLLATLYQTGHVDLWLDDDRDRVIAATDRGLCPCFEGRSAVWVSRRVKS